jgi:hypothetical protein
MNNSQLSRLTLVAVIAASLLAVAITTALSMAEDADARKKKSSSSSKTTTKQTIIQRNIESGDSRNFNSGSNCIGGNCQSSRD